MVMTFDGHGDFHTVLCATYGELYLILTAYHRLRSICCHPCKVFDIDSHIYFNSRTVAQQFGNKVFVTRQ